MKEVLPIGTVVELNQDSAVKLMIVGFLPKNESGEIRDYSAIRYPMGVYDNRMFFFFNHDDIVNVVFKGYENDEFQAMKSLILNYELDKSTN